MRLRIITVGAKQPSWVDAAVTDYLRRFKSPWRVELLEIEVATRGATRSAGTAVRREGERVLAALRDRERVILLDEAGKSLSTRELASKLEACAREAPDLALLIGGPDGHAAAVRERAAASWSLSRLTLPHGLTRVLLVEQLYRTYTLASGHPYHRD